MRIKKQVTLHVLIGFLTILLVSSMLPQSIFAKAYDPETGYEELDIRFWEDKKPEIGFYTNAASRYIIETVPEPEMGSVFGEWSVMNLLRGMYTGYDYMNHIPEDYFDNYTERIEHYVSEKKGNLDRSKSTEWSRLILSLTALGYDITDVASYDFIDKLSSSHRFSYKQGINGPIWEIIAMNTGNYQFYDDTQNDDVNNFGKMIDYVLNLEIEQSDGTIGGWALIGNNPDSDITGMALQSLAPYYKNESLYEAAGAETSYEDFVQAVERGILILSEIQSENGAFEAFGNVNAESTVQVIVALTELGIDPLNENVQLESINKTVNFVKAGAIQDGVWTNNMVDALLTFFANGSGSSPEVAGFKHVTTGYDGGGDSGHGVNAMATDQSLYGLIAYDRFQEDETSLYDMTDMMNAEYKTMKVESYTVTYNGNTNKLIEKETYSPYEAVVLPKPDSVKGEDFLHWNTEADGSGTKYKFNEKLSMPEHDITLYAQYGNEDLIEFTDIDNHWAKDEIKEAVESDLVKGYPDGTFRPKNSITRAEFVKMIASALELKGQGAELTFADNDKILVWVKESVAQAVEAGIIIGSDDNSFRPNATITRSEMAVIIARALDLSNDSNSKTGFADDKTIQDWAREAVVSLEDYNIINGNENNEFMPTNHASRAEGVVMLMRMLEFK